MATLLASPPVLLVVRLANDKRPTVSKGFANAFSGSPLLLQDNALPRRSLLERWKRRTWRPVSMALTDEEAAGPCPPTEAEVLDRFFEDNLGSWTGTFTSFNFGGDPLHTVRTEVASSTYGRGDDRSLLQTLRVLQAPSRTKVEGEEEEGDVWRELDLGETNRFTINRRQQLSYFEDSHAFAGSHKTAEVLERALRIGLLGPDDEDEDSPKGVKLPTTRPALVSESCLCREDGRRRIRAFHVLDPRGVIDTIAVFDESRDGAGQGESPDDNSEGQSAVSRLDALIGEWRGVGKVQRSEHYGSSTEERESRVVYRMEDDGTLTQEVKSSRKGGPENLILRGSLKGSLLEFDGLQTTLLPGGLALSSPTVVARGQAFAFECSWIHAPNRRQRLVRTYDEHGMVVSTTFFLERKEL